MIEHIHIQNFKSVVNAQFKLGRFNVLIGANGTGKTNVLEAITFAGAGSAGKLDNEFLSARGVRVTEAEFMRSQFLESKTKIVIDVDNYEQSIWAEEGPYGNWKSLTEIPPSNKEIERQGLIDRQLSTFLLYAPEESALRNFYQEGQVEPLGIKGEGLFKLLKVLKMYEDDEKFDGKPFTEVLKKLSLIDWFDDLEIANGSFDSERFLKIKDRHLNDLTYFDQRSANEGFLYLLFYLSLFISPDTPSFFAIDNIETALNPKLCTKLMLILNDLSKKYDKQVIFTTHNPAVLDGINLNDDEQRLLVVERNLEGHTKVNRIHSKNGKASKVKLSDAFMKGFIGGLPDNF